MPFGVPTAAELIDTATVASTPGRTEVQPRVWMRCFPEKIAGAVLGALLIAAMIALTIAVAVVDARRGRPLDSGLIACCAVLALVVSQSIPVALVRYRRVQAQFLSGCANPARVVSERPYRIAVLTDLSNRAGYPPHHVVKVVPQPLQRARGPRARVGAPVVTVSLYVGDAPGRWLDFNPIAIPCVTDDPAATARAVDALRREAVEEGQPDPWIQLADALRHVPTPGRPGLYRVPSPPPGL